MFKNIMHHRASSCSDCAKLCCTKIEDFRVKIGNLTIFEDVNLHLHCGQLTALIVPNQNQLADNNIDSDTLKSIMDGNLTTLNEKIPAYASVRRYELQFEPFSKTPKGSIKRFMYK